MKIITYLLIASQTIAPLSSKESIQDNDSQLIAFWEGVVSRVYCSSKSVGFDLHFNSYSGQLYSFNELSNKNTRLGNPEFDHNFSIQSFICFK